MASNNISSDDEIREGFLCPMCMQDFGTVLQLQNHFEEAHSEEDKDVLQSVKEFFGKAKKILKDSSFDLLNEEPKSNLKPSKDWSKPLEWEPQEIGHTKSHWQEFRKLRSNRMDYYAAETNKLIIRLDKIVSDLPNEAGKRREHEQNVVHWINDEDVKLCPQCAKSFNLLRRKHHCRLCGAIQCHPCSQFLLLSFARKLTNPAYVPPLHSEERQRSIIQPERLGSAALHVLRRTGSTTSLTSLVDPGTGEGHIRVCVYCKQLLERRESQMDSGTQKCVLVELYDEMRRHMNTANLLIPTFLKMVDSLSQGESTYNLRDAQECRLRLLKMAEYVDGYSKKILTLGVNDETNPTTGLALSLQSKIRLSAVNFLKDNLLGLPNLPDEDQVKKLQEERKLNIERKIAQEKMAALELRESEMRRKGHLNLKDMEPVSLDRGWGVESVRHVNEDDDPMLQQMDIIRNYIRQARREHRYDEVAILEENLRELQAEHERMKAEQQPIH